MDKSKRNRRKWSPETIALFLLSQDIKWILPGVSSSEILKEFPDLGISRKKLDELRESPEFEDTIQKNFLDKFTNDDSLRKTFYEYLYFVIRTNMNSTNPNTKLLDVLGWMTGLYRPKETKVVSPKLTIQQKARLESILNEAEVKRKLEDKNNQTGKI